MVFRPVRDTTSPRKHDDQDSHIALVAILATITVIVLLCIHVTSVSAAEQRPPFLTMEDQRRCIVQDSNCLKWIYQKALIRPIVQQILIQRGFEQKTAYFIARDWDAFRYDLETGVKILPKPPMLMTTADAVGFASRIPQCFTDMTTSICQIRFAPEYGCNLQRDYAPACRRGFDGVRARFSAMVTDGKTFMSWYDAEYKFYNALACLFGPNGGDIPVFDAGLDATVTKLKFDAGNEAVKFTTATVALPPAAPAPTVTPAPMCKAVIRAGEWRANDEFRDGQELPEQMQAPGLDGSNIPLVLRRRGEPAPATDDPSLTLARPGMPRVAYDDLPDGWLGVDLGRIEDIRTPNATLPRVPVLYVAPNSPAAQAGIQKGDYILRIGGRAVDDALYLGLHMTEAPIGKPMNIVFQRGEKSTTVAVTAIDIEQAGRQDDTSALRYLGDFYVNQRLNGRPNYDKARIYYEKAANLGDAGATARLANIYFNGDKDSDRAEARKWYEKAASAGHVPSIRRLADMYRNAIGGPKDLPRAREWLEKSASNGDINVMYDIVQIDRQEGESKLPDARKWLEKIVATPKSAIPKDADTTMKQAVFELAVVKLRGFGGPKDLVDGRKLMEMAAASATPGAPFQLGLFLVSGEGGPPDFATAKLWFERGTKGENADPNCMWALGMMYKNGEGVAKNPAESRKWLKRAADLGQKDAVTELGLQPPPPPQPVIAPPPIRPYKPPPPITPDMRIAATDAPGPATQGAKSAGKCNPDCVDTAVIGTKIASVSGTNARACRDLCLATNKCTGWIFQTGTKSCDTMQAQVQLFHVDGAIGGTVSRGQ